nr:ribonuclease H-like domain-containing protein [Tanacetum cinerariifolium]
MFRRGILGAVSYVLPSAFSTMANQDPTWNMDTVKDFLTRHILLRCDSSGDLYPITSPSPTPNALLFVSLSTWHQRLGHPGEEQSLYGLKQAPRAWFQRFAGYALRVGFTSSRCDSSLFIYQHERAHMSNCNATRTLVDWESKLGSDGDPVSDSLYIVVLQVPDLVALKRVLRYIRGTLDHGLQLHVSSTSQLNAYTDVTLSRSSAEAEYRGVANVVAETAWIRNLLRELHNPMFTPTLVYCDNVSAVYMSTNHVQHQCTKHIEIDIHFVRDMVARGQVRVLHVPSHYQYVDIFTKGLPTALFEEFRISLSVQSPPAQTAREC